MSSFREQSAIPTVGLLLLGTLLLGAWVGRQNAPSTLPPLFVAGRTVVDTDGTEFPVLEVSGDWMRTRGLSGAEYWLHVPSGRTWRGK